MHDKYRDDWAFLLHPVLLSMARLPRHVSLGQPQHIIQPGNNRQTMFAAESNYQFFRDVLIEAVERFGLAIHAQVWMTNHIHLLATPSREEVSAPRYALGGPVSGYGS